MGREEKESRGEWRQKRKVETREGWGDKEEEEERTKKDEGKRQQWRREEEMESGNEREGWGIWRGRKGGKGMRIQKVVEDGRRNGM